MLHTNCANFMHPKPALTYENVGCTIDVHDFDKFDKARPHTGPNIGHRVRLAACMTLTMCTYGVS